MAPTQKEAIIELQEITKQQSALISELTQRVNFLEGKLFKVEADAAIAANVSSVKAVN